MSAQPYGNQTPSDAWASPDEPLLTRVSRRGNVVEFVEVFVAEMEGKGVKHQQLRRMIEAEYLRRALVIEQGNKCAAARRIGIHRNSFQRALERCYRKPVASDLTARQKGLKHGPQRAVGASCL